ncbi:unnamed protein product [Symbiodinium natans]|uniref:Uncharacterized protein n=1 Tax=Symbiodinium natans TaxID=878477 RepID=A0A812MQH5_9DINO|nr:unnamed protein product [Symbiodinium natans]
MTTCCGTCSFTAFARLFEPSRSGGGRPAERPQTAQRRCPPPPPGDSLLKSFCDEVLGGGASLGSLYAYLNLSEALLVLRPTCRALALASKATPRLRAPLSIEPEDIEELVALQGLQHTSHTGHAGHVHAGHAGHAPSRQALANANAPEAILRKVTQLLRAANSVAMSLSAKAPSLAGRLFRLALPFGLPNSVIRAWGRANLLAELTELHLLGSGGPSDAGLMHLAKLCPKLRRLTLLGGQSSAASALLLQAQSEGAMSDDWWRGFRCTRLCILPRLQHTKLKGLSVQRVPSWFCGHWSPVMPTWGHEVHCYDSLGRFVCLRNGLVERIGVVRSLLPSQFGNWWELEISFLARQDTPSQLVLLLPLSGEGAQNPAGAWEPWAGVQKEPASIVRGAMALPSDCWMPSSVGRTQRRRPRPPPAVPTPRPRARVEESSLGKYGELQELQGVDRKWRGLILWGRTF